MKRHLSIILFCIVCGVCIFIYPQIIATGIKNGIILCGNIIIPSLFPFLAVCSFLIRSDSLNALNKYFAKISKYLIRLPACTFPVFILSLIAGYPVGAKLSNTLYNKNRLSKNQAKQLSLISCSAGPAFIINAVGIGMLRNAQYGYILLSSHLLSSMFCAVLFSRQNDSDDISSTIFNEKTSISDSFVLGVLDASSSIISICSLTILFSAICSLFSAFPLGAPLIAISEVTSGCLYFAKMHNIPLVSFVLGFGGISVICQCKSVGKETMPKFSRILFIRLCHGGLSFLTTTFLLKIFPIKKQVLSTFSQAVATPYYSSLKLSVSLVMMIIVFFSFCSKKIYEKT